MRITIVMGFFLPVPPESGGATEKTWHRLATEFAARGHAVTLISRQWHRLPRHERAAGVDYVRLPGYDHRRRLWQNLVLDALWSLRVHRMLPKADVCIAHCVALPVWLGTLLPRAGRVVVMPGRMPKGQYRHYRRIAGVIATSTPVRQRVIAENPALAPVTQVYGYPIAWKLLAQVRPRVSPDQIATIGFAGRLHPEKGIDLLLDAILRLNGDFSLPKWRLSLCGPDSVSAGGGGPSYRAAIERRLHCGLPPDRWQIRPPLFAEHALASFYSGIDIFCYPSCATHGETFGVAVAEAMAAGSVPVVSNLACFRDYVSPNVNGLVFEHIGPDAASQLATALASLLRDPKRRAKLAAAAQASVRRYDYASYADSLLRDFERMLVTPAFSAPIDVQPG